MDENEYKEYLSDKISMLEIAPDLYNSVNTMILRDEEILAFLESYVFVWTNHEAVLLYDSLSGKGLTWNLTDPVRTIVMELIKKRICIVWN